MNQAVLTSLALSLLLTVALETGFFLLTSKLFASILFTAKRDKNPDKNPDKKPLPLAALVVLVNILTNPVVVLLYWLTVLYTDWNTVIIVILLEFFAVFIEGCYYKKYGGGFRNPYVF